MADLLVTNTHIDNLHDAMTMMRLFSQRLSEGEVDNIEAGEMSWLLGSAKKRLEPVIELLEQFEWHQTHGEQPATPTDDLLKLGTDILALTEKLNRRRCALKGAEA